MNPEIAPKTLRCALGASLLLLTAGLASGASSNSVVTFRVDLSAQVSAGSFVPGVDTVAARGTFNGYGQFFLTNNPAGANTNLYTGTLTDTTEANGSVMNFKYWNSDVATGNNGYETTADGHDRAARLPSNSGGALVLPQVFFSDAGTPVTSNVKFQVDMAQQINVGAFNPQSSTVYSKGDFNGYNLSLPLTNDPTILRTNQFGLVTTNVYTGSIDITVSPNAPETFKYFIDTGNNWESPGPGNADPGNSGNRFFDVTNQALPIVYFSDAPYAPVATNAVTFRVDMSNLTGGVFDPSQDTVDVRGNFNSWSAGVNVCTNNPSAPNTNIYSATVTIIDGVGSTEQYKFTYNGANVNGGTGGTVWENPNPPTIGGNRFFVQPNLTATNLPAVLFSDTGSGDLVTTDTWVTFSVNMTNAVGTDTHAFDGGVSDSVYLNGDFVGWRSWNAIALASYQMTNNPIGSDIFSLQVLIPRGNPLLLHYKYGMVFSGQTTSVDDEAPANQNHGRYVRTANNYTMPLDRFGNQYGEPDWGLLNVGAASGGHVPVTWLGRPHVHLQTSTNLTSWVDRPETDGAGWTTGTLQSPSDGTGNGFISRTNYSTGGGKSFFRLIKPGS
jgi:hypothetical protein